MGQQCVGGSDTEKQRVDAAIGKRLFDFRREHGVTQKKLGEVLGISFQQVQKYEWGKSRISVRAIHQICTHYNVSPIIFFPQGDE